MLNFSKNTPETKNSNKKEITRFSVTQIAQLNTLIKEEVNILVQDKIQNQVQQQVQKQIKEMKDIFLKDVKHDLMHAFSETLENKIEQLKVFEQNLLKFDANFFKMNSQSNVQSYSTNFENLSKIVQQQQRNLSYLKKSRTVSTLNSKDESNEKLKAKIKEISSQYNHIIKIDSSDKNQQTQKQTKGSEGLSSVKNQDQLNSNQLQDIKITKSQDENAKNKIQLRSKTKNKSMSIKMIPNHSESNDIHSKKQVSTPQSVKEFQVNKNLKSEKQTLLDRNESDKLIYSPRRKTITSELKVKLNEFEKQKPAIDPKKTEQTANFQNLRKNEKKKPFQYSMKGGEESLRQSESALNKNQINGAHSEKLNIVNVKSQDLYKNKKSETQKSVIENDKNNHQKQTQDQKRKSRESRKEKGKSVGAKQDKQKDEAKSKKKEEKIQNSANDLNYNQDSKTSPKRRKLADRKNKQKDQSDNNQKSQFTTPQLSKQSENQKI